MHSQTQIFGSQTLRPNSLDLGAARRRCLAYRRRILDVSQQVTALHVAPAFSCLEIVDALYHALQVFELAREVRPYDEEFLLAALLHDVGKAIDPTDHVALTVDALRGAVTERTLWLVEHHMDLLVPRKGGPSARIKRAIEGSEYYDDLKLLSDLDDAGRVPGAVVGTIEEALAYLKGLEDEAYLEDGDETLK